MTGVYTSHTIKVTKSNKKSSLGKGIAFSMSFPGTDSRTDQTKANIFCPMSVVCVDTIRVIIESKLSVNKWQRKLEKGSALEIYMMQTTIYGGQ